MRALKIGLIGTGFMGRAHSNAFAQVNKFFDHQIRPVLTAVCATNAEKTAAFAAQWGWQSVETDWRALVNRPDIDVVDICTPNNTHCAIALEAAKAGKIIICEKPLAMNAAEALAMVEAVAHSGQPSMVSFNYRRIPAVTLAKQLVDEGRLGRIFHYRAKYLQDLDDQPQSAAGRQYAVAARRPGCGQRCDW